MPLYTLSIRKVSFIKNRIFSRFLITLIDAPNFMEIVIPLKQPLLDGVPRKNSEVFRSSVRRSMWSRIARYPRHRLSSIEFRINIGRKRRTLFGRESCSNGSVPKVGNKVRGGKEKSPGFWRDCSLFRVAPSFLKQRVSLLQPVFAVTLLYAESVFL